MMKFLEQRFGANGFVGEHLWLGHFGHWFVLLSFFAAVLATLAYFAAEFNKDEQDKNSWIKLGRSAFVVHGVSVFLIFLLLFVMILNHMFEYHYAWRHSSTDLPIKYIISSFWEGQEGSFLLWQFWLVVIGLVGLNSFRKYEEGVMGVLSLTQSFLGSMVLGIYVLGHKIGSNPFILLRDEMSEAPIFSRPDYLSMISDGNGLNPLLQNYWMTIHPPVLFLGFALTSVPFAFAVTALIRKDYKDWVKPALSWALLTLAILGTGILMGGAWAYESLSFGGFWAWDPVENMSFVPWLLLVAGIHTHLVYKYTGHSLKATLLFYIFSFAFVLYSTFLTRSGILGDTSVHAFTDLGMSGQLIVYLAALVVPPVVLLVLRWRGMPQPAKEESELSREFWMFIGSLVLLLSAVQMTFTTSIPVWNKIFGLKLAPPADVIAHYNDIQIWLGISVAAFTGLVQFLSYKSGKLPSTARYGLYAFGVSVVVSVLVGLGMEIPFTAQHVIDFGKYKSLSWIYVKFPFISSAFLLLLSSVYAVFGNLFYLVLVAKNNIKIAGGSLAHLGFGVFLVGVILSQGKKEVISINQSGIDFGKEFKQKEKLENVLLLRDSAVSMGSYTVSYRGMTVDPPNNYYSVLFRDRKSGEEFELKPNAQINPKMGLIANPDTRHYLHKDVFTHVSSVPDRSQESDSVSSVEVAVGDTFILRNSFAVLKALNPNPALPADFNKENKLLVGAELEVATLSGKVFNATPVFIINLQDNTTSGFEDSISGLGLRFALNGIDPENKKMRFEIHQKQAGSDFIILKAIVFPYINLVWLGGILCFAGALLSVYRRSAEAAAA